MYILARPGPSWKSDPWPAARCFQLEAGFVPLLLRRDAPQLVDSLLLLHFHLLLLHALQMERQRRRRRLVLPGFLPAMFLRFGLLDCCPLLPLCFLPLLFPGRLRLILLQPLGSPLQKLLLLDFLPGIVALLGHQAFFELSTPELLRLHELVAAPLGHQDWVLLIMVTADHGAVHVIHSIHKLCQVVIQIIHLTLMHIAPGKPAIEVYGHLVQVAGRRLAAQPLHPAEEPVCVDLAAALIIQDLKEHLEILEGDAKQSQAVSHPEVAERGPQLVLVQLPRFVRIRVVEDLLHGLQDLRIHSLLLLLFPVRGGTGASQSALHHHADDGVHQRQARHGEEGDEHHHELGVRLHQRPNQGI
mmetsp:Transcript_69471/g.165623  ORF Transcript_69471/g.165623 Transcript_69471/m.165623 type:complete len:358 (+) Transcript_69471:79-1152(+)